MAEERSRAAAECVRTPSRGQVDPEPPALDLEVRASRRHVDLVEGAVVEVGGGGSGRGHVRDDQAVQAPGVVPSVRTLGRDLALRPALVAGDVHAVDQDARDHPQHRPRVACGGDPLQLLRRQGRRGPALPRAHQRALGGHRHRLVHAPYRHRERQLHVLARHHLYLAHDTREAAEGEREAIAAAVEAQEAELSPASRGGGAGAELTRDRHRDAGQHGSRRVGHGAVHVAGVDLGGDGWRCRQQRERQEDAPHFVCTGPKYRSSQSSASL